MKKIFSYFTIFICLLILGNVKNVYAVELDTDNISNSTYIIGKCMFTRDISDNYSGSLSTDVIMLASKTIESDELKDMIIYYKNARGVWINALTNKIIEIPNKVNIEYKNNEIYLATPTLASGIGETGVTIYNKLSIGDWGYYATTSALNEIDGFEYYEKVDDKYILLDDNNVLVDIGEKKTYVARVYKLNKKGEKVYSEYSNEFVIDNSKVETPTLGSGIGSSRVIEYRIFTISDEGYYVTEEALARITSWELYEKVDDKYILLDSNKVEVDIGEKKTYVARAYGINKKGERIYSEYSKEVVIDNSKVETPTLTTPIGTGTTYAVFSITDEGYYAAKDAKAIDGFELYEKVDKQYILLDSVKVTLGYGEIKTYVARAYGINKKGERIYSEYSKEFVIDNSKGEPPTYGDVNEDGEINEKDAGLIEQWINGNDLANETFNFFNADVTNDGKVNDADFVLLKKYVSGVFKDANLPDEPLGKAIIIEYIVDDEVYSRDYTLENIKFDTPDAPTKEGYTFVGWYTDSDYTTEYDFNSTDITSNITLYAKFE